MTCLRLACISSATAFAAGTATAREAAYGMVEDRLSQQPAVVRKARAAFASVRADALNRWGGRNMLAEAMERWSN
jgi:hypothetical protein